MHNFEEKKNTKMKKKIKILIPIDFSNCSDNALAYGIRLADKLDATVEVLHVATPDSIPMDYPSFVGQNVQILRILFLKR